MYMANGGYVRRHTRELMVRVRLFPKQRGRGEQFTMFHSSNFFLSFVCSTSAYSVSITLTTKEGNISVFSQEKMIHFVQQSSAYMKKYF